MYKVSSLNIPNKIRTVRHGVVKHCAQDHPADKDLNCSGGGGGDLVLGLKYVLSTGLLGWLENTL